MFKKMISIIPVAVLSVTVGANVQAETITVQDGDTLWDLSRANNTSVENIQKLNQLTSDLIHPGDVLTVTQEKNYTVKQGDTLWDIARNHQVTVSQIKEWNQLGSDLIHPNLDLVIFEGVKNHSIALSSTPKKENTSKAAALVTKNTTSTDSTPKATAPATESKDRTPEVAVKPVKPASTTQPSESTPTVTAPTTNTNDSKEIIVEATAYTASCEGCSGVTYTGIDLKANPDAKVISVDPSVIPLGSKVYVEGYGEAIAGDTGGAIKGNKIDVFIPSKQEAINFGRKQVKVKILD